MKHNSSNEIPICFKPFTVTDKLSSKEPISLKMEHLSMFHCFDCYLGHCVLALRPTMQMTLGLWPQLKGQNSKNPWLVKPGNMVKFSQYVTLSERKFCPNWCGKTRWTMTGSINGHGKVQSLSHFLKEGENFPTLSETVGKRICHYTWCTS